MRAIILAAGLAMAATSPAAAGPVEEVRELYVRFQTAQNERDLARVRDLLLPSERFLWVSDGRSVWGPDATLARMASFQQAEIWHVDPDLGRAVAVEIDDGSAFLHLPLVLDIGAARPGPDHLRFLVSVLGVATPAGWRIAALFTTEHKAP